ncbi:MAG TPA: SRPBCC domain-containing protein [Staphylococcus sp.]|nr:SRPBCC domain-containing protein [Staphylococcus sp.]
MTIQVEENKIIFTREFDTSAQNIFKAYTDRALFEQWFHPQGASTEVYEFNIHTGGNAFFAIRAPQGTSYTVTNYIKVTEPKLIEYYDYFADKEGNIDKKMAGMHNTIHIEENGKGNTTIKSIAKLPDPKAAQQLLDMGVEEGMNSTFDNLEILIKKL